MAKRSGVWRSIMSRIASIRRSSASRAGCTIRWTQTRPMARMPCSRASRQQRVARRALVLAGDRPPAARASRCRGARGAPRDAAPGARSPVRPARPSNVRPARRSPAPPRGRARPSRRGSNPGRSRGPGSRRTRRGARSIGSHAARSQTSPGSSTSALPRGGGAEGRGRRFRAHGRFDPRASLQARFTARAVRAPKRENTRRALPSKILARSSALSHSIGSRYRRVSS